MCVLCVRTCARMCELYRCVCVCVDFKIRESIEFGSNLCVVPAWHWIIMG